MCSGVKGKDKVFLLQSYFFILSLPFKLHSNWIAKKRTLSYSINRLVQVIDILNEYTTLYISCFLWNLRCSKSSPKDASSLLWEGEREARMGGRGEMEMWKRNFCPLPPAHALNGDQTCNPGMCPDRKSNLQPFGVQDNVPTNSAIQQGPLWTFLRPLLFGKIHCRIVQDSPLLNLIITDFFKPYFHFNIF